MATLDEVLDMVEAGRDEIIALARDLVRINTVSTGVMPTGNETPAADKELDGQDAGVVEVRQHAFEIPGGQPMPAR